MRIKILVLSLTLSASTLAFTAACSRSQSGSIQPKTAAETKATNEKRANCDPGPAPVFSGPTTFEVNQSVTLTWIAAQPLPKESFIIHLPTGDQTINGDTAVLSIPTPGTYTAQAVGLDVCENTVTLNFVLTVIPALGTPTMAINGGASSTVTAAANLTMVAPGATQMFITNDPACSSGGTWQTFAATLPWTLVGESKNTQVFGAFRNAVNTSACISAGIMYDKTAPIVSFTTTPAKSTNSAVANFVFAVTDAVSGVKTFSCALDSAGMAPCDLTKSVTVAAGSHTMNIQAVDNLGNTSAILPYSWTYTPTPLGKPSIIINGGAAGTNNALVTLTLNSTNATVMYITNDPTCSTGGTWQPYATTASWTLPAEGTNVTVSAMFGQGDIISACVTAGIMFDKTPPVIAFLTTPPATTNSTTAAFTFSATDAISGIGSFTCGLEKASNMQPCPSLSSTTSNLAAGPHTMFIQATDKLGNASAIQSYSWNITPSLGTPFISINGGAASTTSAAVTLTLGAPGATQMCVTNDPTCATGCTMQPIASTLPWTLPAEGKAISVSAMFSLGTATTKCVNASIMYDKTPPVVSFVKAPPQSTNDTFANFVFSAFDAVSGVKSFTCALDDVTKMQPCPLTPTVYPIANLIVGTHTMYIQAADNLGNISATLPFTWVVKPLDKPVTQDFTVDSSGLKVDVLVIDDNSPSMIEEQHQIRKRFRNFINSLSGLDWQLGIVTTDVSKHHLKRPTADGKLLAFRDLPKGANTFIINADTPNVNNVFLDTVYRHTWEDWTSSDDERGIYAMLRALQRPENKSLFRPNSLIATIVVTDEDERSDEYNLKPEDMPENLLAYLKANYPTNTFVNSSMIFQKITRVCPQVGSYSHGKLYEKLSEMTGGAVGDVCQPDYATTLDVIAQKAQQNPYTVTLQCAPIDGSISVTMTPQPAFKVDYTLNDLQLTFTPYPPVGTKIEVTYNCKAANQGLNRSAVTYVRTRNGLQRSSQ